MKDILISLLKIVLRIGFAYGVCLLFTTEVNILEWRTLAKVWFIIISIILLSAD